LHPRKGDGKSANQGDGGFFDTLLVTVAFFVDRRLEVLFNFVRLKQRLGCFGNEDSVSIGLETMSGGETVEHFVVDGFFFFVGDYAFAAVVALARVEARFLLGRLGDLLGGWRLAPRSELRPTCRLYVVHHTEPERPTTRFFEWKRNPPGAALHLTN
jgi:hypothetical protein